MIQSDELRLVPGFVIRFIFKFTPYTYFRGVKTWPGFFYARRCWWVDISTLPTSVSMIVQHYTILHSDMYKKKMRRLKERERIYLMSVMLTLDEAVQLTRISKEAMKKAIVFGQIKSVNFGGNVYIPRAELERVLGQTIDENRLNNICYHPFY